jgi:hypothetical protein
MDDVVLSVVKNRFWKDLDVYALSLCQSGYQGRKVMFVEDVPTDAQENLKVLGFEVIPFVTPAEYQRLHFQSYRYYVALQFLKKEASSLRFVIWTDVCDLLFQRDPISHVSAYSITAAKEGRKISAGGGQGWNEIWLRHFLPKKDADALMDEEVLCSGSIAADATWMEALFINMWEFLRSCGDLRGIDQGVYNYVVRPPFSCPLCVPEMSEGFVSTCGMFMSEYNNHEWTVPPPYLDREEGLVRVSEGGKPFAIVHCYDRTGGFLNPIGDFRGIVERRYRK